MIAAIYARKSTTQDVADDAKSVTRQIEHARAFAAARGWRVDDAHIYVDDGISGAEFERRPAFLRMMNALKPRAPFHVLVMSEESRLGREAIETAYALKQLITAGVRVWFYLDGRERTLETPTDKLLMSVTAFADELEREKARQRVYDAMSRKARAGHVTGGRTFGYDNVEVLGEPDAHGKRQRQRVERQINDTEAAVVRRIFEMCAGGTGYTRIAKTLNAEGAPSPRPQQSRPAGWAPSSVREVLHRELYRGHVTWNRTKKRDAWGQRKFLARPETEWMHHHAPGLRIVSDELWTAAHARLRGLREHLERASGGRLGRRVRDIDSNYLLPGFARCAVCGGGMCVTSRSHGKRRAYFYACLANHKRGAAVCGNATHVPMAHVDRAVLGALADDVLSERLILAVVDGVLDALAAPAAPDHTRERNEVVALDAEINRLTEAIATAGGALPSLVAALRSRQERRDELHALLAAVEPQTPLLVNRKAVERAVRAKLTDWRRLLTDNVQDGRELLRRTLAGPLKFSPEQEGYRFEGEAAIGRILEGAAGLPTKVASLNGTAQGCRHRFGGFAA